MLSRIFLGWLLSGALLALPCVVRAEDTPALLTPNDEDEAAPDRCPTLSLLEDACLPLVYLRGERIFEPLHETEQSAAPVAKSSRPRTPPGLSYQLGDSMIAGLSYRHSFLSGLSSSDLLRNEPLTNLNPDTVQDSLKLEVSWALPQTVFDLGYRFDAARDPSSRMSLLSPNRLWPEDERVTHSLMLGFTRQWGGAR